MKLFLNPLIAFAAALPLAQPASAQQFTSSAAEEPTKTPIEILDEIRTLEVSLSNTNTALIGGVIVGVSLTLFSTLRASGPTLMTLFFSPTSASIIRMEAARRAAYPLVLGGGVTAVYAVLTNAQANKLKFEIAKLRKQLQAAVTAKNAL